MEDYLDSGFVLYDDRDYEDHPRREERDSRIVSYDDGDEPMPHELDYEYEYEYDYQTNEEESLGDIYTHCLYPTLSDAVGYVLPLIVASALFKTAAQSSYTSPQVFHGVSTLLGIYVVQRYMIESSYLLITLVAASYLILCLPVRCRRGPVVGFLCLCLMLYGERWMKPASWHKIRGVAMIASMKAVGVAVEADSSPLLNPFEYTGYILCPATCLFGPWVCYKDYATLYRANPWSLRRIFVAVGYLLAALFFLSVSNCWAQWMLPDTGWKWAVAYREALSFRASHYFISYASGSMALLGGFSSSAATVVKPWSIEAPRSLVQVVVHWNIPMHTWLKTYVFRRSRVRLGKFGAVLLTYAASSLLHGLNFQLAAVLLSLGFYTYVEFQLRHELANIFDACIAAKRCGNQKCTHKRTADNCWWVIPINLLFSGLAIFHLAYLGLMFDTSEQQETGYSYSHAMEKWSSLSFASHWVVLATYFAYFMIK